MGFAWALTGAMPALFGMWYVDLLGARRQEQRRSLWLVGIAGAFAVLPVIVLGIALSSIGPDAASPYQHAAYHGFVVARGLEEAVKFLAVLWLVWSRPVFKDRVDGIIYAMRAGLGFALIENIFYLAGTESVHEFMGVYVARALLAVPAHAVWTGLIGYFAARRRFDGKGIGMLGGYLLAVACHGLYDVAIFWSPLLLADGSETAGWLLLAVPLLVLGGSVLLLRSLAGRAMVQDHAAQLGRLSEPPPPVIIVSATACEADSLAEKPIALRGPQGLRNCRPEWKLPLNQRLPAS